MDAGEDLHHRRLSGTVLAEQRMRFAGIERDRTVFEGSHRTERLGGVCQHEDWLAVGARGGEVDALAGDGQWRLHPILRNPHDPPGSSLRSDAGS